MSKPATGRPQGRWWKTVSEGRAFEGWRWFCVNVLNRLITQYAPLDQSGSPMCVPSSAPPAALPTAELPTSPAEAQVLHPLKLRGVTLRNRIVRAAAYEGSSLADITEHHCELARGGVALTTVAYCCVAADGLSFDEQLLFEDTASCIRQLQKFTDAVHREAHNYDGGGRIAIAAQLTHGGSFADRSVIRRRLNDSSAVQIAPSGNVFNPAGIDFPRTMDEADISRVISDFACAASVAVRAGFDAIELHCGHGYLLSQWASPYANRRTDAYGGTPQRRARVPVECLLAIRRAVGPHVPVLVKFNMHDGMAGGLELREALVHCRMYAAAGADVLVPSVGWVSANGFYMLRGAVPLPALIQALPGTTKKLGALAFGPLAVPSVEYEPAFLRQSARSILALAHELNTKSVTGAAISDAPGVQVCLLGGVDSLAVAEGAVREGFTLVQMARALVREPDFVARMQRTLALPGTERRDVRSRCIHCNLCVIATIDPSVPPGCPFLRLERRRQSKQKQKVEKASRNVAAWPVRADLHDSEDIEELDSLLVRSFGACSANTRL